MRTEESNSQLSNIYGTEIGYTISNTPVPVILGRPRTILLEGVRRSSKSPCSVASLKNAAVVSYDAFSNGDELVEIPLRLNGLYPPSNVCKLLSAVNGRDPTQ